MPAFTHDPSRPTIGIIGFGAFGRLMARHLAPHFRLCAYDPMLQPGSDDEVAITSLAVAARCPIVVLASPVGSFEQVTRAIGPHLPPGALVLDVGSVKTIPVEIMRRNLPPHVEIVGTHPLFGPQSAADGVHGLKIAVCPVRDQVGGRAGRRVAAFLRRRLRLRVILTTPEAHDREAATVQGLTHLIAKVLVEMEPLPRSMTTRSFDLLLEAIGMVRDDAPAVFQAIERLNPYATDVRRRFFALAAALEAKLDGDEPRATVARLRSEAGSVEGAIAAGHD